MLSGCTHCPLTVGGLSIDQGQSASARVAHVADCFALGLHSLTGCTHCPLTVSGVFIEQDQSSTTPVGSVIVRSFGGHSLPSCDRHWTDVRQVVNDPGRECHSPFIRWSLLAVVCYGQTSDKSATPVGSVIVRSFGGHSLPSCDRHWTDVRQVVNYPGRECCNCRPVRTPCRRVPRTDVRQASDRSATPVGSVTTVSRCALLAVAYYGHVRQASDKSTTPVGSVATVSRCALLAVVCTGKA